jgi:hypothetical protein
MNIEFGRISFHWLWPLSVYYPRIFLSIYLSMVAVQGPDFWPTPSTYIYLSIYPSIHPFICLSIHLSIYLSIYFSICLSLSIYLWLYLSAFQILNPEHSL